MALFGHAFVQISPRVLKRSKTGQVGEIQRTADLRQLWPVAKKVQLVYMKDHESTCEELGIE
jgi:hypothetical protein